MLSYVLGFEEIDQTQVAIVGGKGAHLGGVEGLPGLPASGSRSASSSWPARLMFAR
jgi:rifampicin phosphotransferase